MRTFFWDKCDIVFGSTRIRQRATETEDLLSSRVTAVGRAGFETQLAQDRAAELERKIGQQALEIIFAASIGACLGAAPTAGGFYRRVPLRTRPVGRPRNAVDDAAYVRVDQ